MLSKSAAKAFFLGGTAACTGAFLLLTLDTMRRVPAQTRSENLTESVIRGKHLWDTNNCMGCHTILGEGAYYAPELTKVYERRGPVFIQSVLKDPEAMFPGQRKMQNYHFNDQQIADLTDFLKWIGEMDLNGFPPKPSIGPLSIAAQSEGKGQSSSPSRPKIFDQVCLACHSVQGLGSKVGPAFDGIGSRRNRDYLVKWLTNPLAIKPDSKMPKIPLSDVDLQEIADYLSQLKQQG
jgi:nitric oxide reductase subunit C